MELLLLLELKLLLLLLLSESVGRHGWSLLLAIEHVRLICVCDPCHLSLMLLHGRMIG